MLRRRDDGRGWVGSRGSWPLLRRILPLVAALIAATACSSLSGLSTEARDASVDSTSVEGGGDAGPQDAAPTCNCTLAPPPGWMGPVAVYVGTPSDEPACGYGTTPMLQASADLEVPPPRCPRCACGPPANASCPGGNLSYFLFGAGCSSASCGSGAETFGECVGPCADPPTSVTVFVAPDASATGSCVPGSTGSATPPPLGWSTTVVGCGATAIRSGTCGIGNVCEVAAAPPFSPGQCVYREGESACPGAPYMVKSTYYTSATDTRGCTPCACGTSLGPCGLEATLYSTAPTAGCAATSIVGRVPVSATSLGCAPLPDHPAWQSMSLAQALPTDGGACAPSGGAATGGATAAGPVTVCCTQ